jgi:hypothetical protein
MRDQWLRKVLARESREWARMKGKTSNHERHEKDEKRIQFKSFNNLSLSSSSFVIFVPFVVPSHRSCLLIRENSRDSRAKELSR